MPRRPKYEEIDLTPEEEATLDRVWDEVGEREGTEPEDEEEEDDDLLGNHLPGKHDQSSHGRHSTVRARHARAQGKVPEKKGKQKDGTDWAKARTFNSLDNLEEAANYARSTHGEWGKKLTSGERATLVEYTNVKAYEVPGGSNVPTYYRVNDSLRKGDGEVEVTDRAFVRLMDSSIAKAPPTKEPLLMYRGVGDPPASQMTPGSTFTDKGYTSVSHNEAVGRNFSEKALVEVRVPRGKKMASMDAIKATGDDPGDSENEYVFPRGSRFRVVSERVDDRGVRVITTEIVS